MEREQTERDFKGVWFPKEIFLNKNLNWIEKILVLEIHSLDKGYGCWAGNNHFADFLNCSESNVANMLTKMRRMGIIDDRSFDGRKRFISINPAFLTQMGILRNPTEEAESPKKVRQGSNFQEGRVPENRNEITNEKKEFTAQQSHKETTENTPSNTYNNTINNKLHAFRKNEKREKEVFLQTNQDNDLVEIKGKAPPMVKKDYRPDVSQLAEYWNQFGTYEKLGRGGTPSNPTVKTELLPPVNVLTPEAIKVTARHIRTYKDLELIKQAIRNYIVDVCNRKPSDSDYHRHRLSFYDFMYQKNGLVKFINR